MAKNITRRGFVKGVPITAAAIAATSAVAGSALADESDAPAFVERKGAGEGVNMDYGAVRSGADPIAPREVPEAWDEEADVIVVGTGLGGTTAALYAAEAGASVIAVEKDAIIGGAARHASMIMINTGGTRLQTEAGFTWPAGAYAGEFFDADNDSDVKIAVAAYLKEYRYSPNWKLLFQSVKEGPKFGDWISSRRKFEMVTYGGSFKPLRDKYLQDNGLNEVLGYDNMFNMLEEEMIEDGITLMKSSPCVALVADGDSVVGIVVETDGEEKYLHATKGVILAAGGMGYNMDLLEKYIPIAYMAAASGGPTPAHTGECIRMGMGMGADMTGMNGVSFWNGVLDEYYQGSLPIWYSYMYRPMNMFNYLPYLRFDRALNRLPLYEGKNGATQPLFEGMPFTSSENANIAAYTGVGDRRDYMVWDANFRENFDNEWKGTQFEYFNPATMLLGPALSEAGAAYMPADFEADWEDALAKGAVRQADTLEELAELWGFDPEKFVALVEHWNELCEKGEDTDLPVPLLAEWMIPVKNPPFYCGCWGGNIGKTQCGLRTNEKMEVMSKECKPIPGLYAVWSTAGGLTGENDTSDFGSCTPFGSVGASGVTGFMAAKAVLGEYDDLSL